MKTTQNLVTVFQLWEEAPNRVHLTWLSSQSLISLFIFYYVSLWRCVCVCADIQSPEVLDPPRVESYSCWAAWHGCRYGTWQEQFTLSHWVVPPVLSFLNDQFTYSYMGWVEVRRWLVCVNSVFLPPESQWSNSCHQAWVLVVLWSTEPNWRPWSCVSYFEIGCFNVLLAVLVDQVGFKLKSLPVSALMLARIKSVCTINPVLLEVGKTPTLLAKDQSFLYQHNPYQHNPYHLLILSL